MPWWVPFVFVYCLFIGWRLSKQNTVPVFAFFIAPLILIGMAFKIGSIHYIISLISGAAIGFMISFKTPIIIHKNKITIPGSWHFMLLIMTIFFTKFTMGWLHALKPIIAQQYQFIEWIIQGGIAGFFFGKGLNFTYRYWKNK